VPDENIKINKNPNLEGGETGSRRCGSNKIEPSKVVKSNLSLPPYLFMNYLPRDPEAKTLTEFFMKFCVNIIVPLSILIRRWLNDFR
jgi:hypothetical protein